MSSRLSAPSLPSGLYTDDVSVLHERAEGWVAGLQIAASSLRGREDPHALVAAFAGDHSHIAGYFAEEVLAKQPPPVQEFLKLTAVLERLSGSPCDAVTLTSNSQYMLEHLERANLASGLSNRYIAAALFLTTGTVKTHVHNIPGKLAVESRTQAIARASETGLLEA